MPLVLPIIVLVATSKRAARPGKVFWVSRMYTITSRCPSADIVCYKTTWIIFNLALSLVFGFLHQGGVVPSLFYLHSTLADLSSAQSTHIVYWKTYLPPRHLLGVPQQGITSIRFH